MFTNFHNVEIEAPHFPGFYNSIYDTNFIDYDALLAKFNLSWQDVDDNSRQLDLIDYINNLED